MGLFDLLGSGNSNGSGSGMVTPSNQQQMNPQALAELSQIQQLQKAGSQPTTSNGTPIAGAGVANGVSQIANALLAKQMMAQWQKKWGIQTPQTQAPQTQVQPTANTPPGTTTNFDDSPGTTTTFDDDE
jgi:hypothetical protein